MNSTASACLDPARTLAWILAISSSVAAQQMLVVPSGFGAQAGNSRASIAGVSGSGHQQIVVEDVHLLPLVGKSITAIEFRRAKSTDSFVGGASQLTVSLSPSTHAPIAASAVFAGNRASAPAVVFSGTVLVPNSPASPGPSIPWSVENVIRVSFQFPHLYMGGHLCIDLDGVWQQGVSPAWWPVDAVRQVLDSSVVDMGPGTGPHCNPSGGWSMVDPADLCAGGEVRMSASGGNPALVMGMLGRPSAFPIPLAPFGIGAPGAMAYLEEIYLSQLFFMVAPPIPHFTVGLSDWIVGLPNESWVVGLELASQWVDLSTWDVSNGIRFRVAGTVPTLGLANIDGAVGAADGDRSVQAAPLLRFEFTNP